MKSRIKRHNTQYRSWHPGREVSSRLRHKGTPALESGNIARAGDVGGFDDKAFDGAAVGQPHGTDREWRGNRGDEFSEARCRERPNLELDRGSRSRLDAQHAGFWWRGVERVELVVRRGRGCLQQASAERLQ